MRPMVAAQRFHSRSVGIYGVQFAPGLHRNAAVAQHILCHIPAGCEGQPLGRSALHIHDLDVRSRGRCPRASNPPVRNGHGMGAIGLTMDELPRRPAGGGRLPDLPRAVGAGLSGEQDLCAAERYHRVRGRVEGRRDSLPGTSRSFMTRFSTKAISRAVGAIFRPKR